MVLITKECEQLNYSIYTGHKPTDIVQIHTDLSKVEATFLGVVNERPDIYQKVEFNNQMYVIGSINDEHNVAFCKKTQELEQSTI